MLQPVPTEPRNEGEASDTRAQRASATAAPTSPLQVDPAWRAGRKLAEARLQRGWSIDEVADRIRVRREFLAALEDMNIKLLPGKAYALAFLRSYARELGLDEKAIVDQFQDESALTREDAKQPIRNPSSKPKKERPWMWAAALVLIAAGFVGWRAVGSGSHVEAANRQDVPASASAPASTTQSAASEQRVVEVRAIQQGWLEARGPDGTVFLSRTLQPGDVYRPDPSPGWTLHARDGGAFEVYVNGASAGPLGIAGTPVLGRQIDAIQPIAQAQVEAPRS